MPLLEPSVRCYWGVHLMRLAPNASWLVLSQRRSGWRPQPTPGSTLFGSFRSRGWTRCPNGHSSLIGKVQGHHVSFPEMSELNCRACSNIRAGIAQVAGKVTGPAAHAAYFATSSDCSSEAAEQ